VENKIKFESLLTNFERVNPEFAKAKVNICYAGKNRNGSVIPQETLDKMTSSLYGVPVVGEWIEEEQDFGGHGGKLEVDDKGMRYIETTRPYGFVDPTIPAFYEKVKEKDGITENDYLSCYVYLWYKRYPELEKVLNDGAKQSMELSINNAHVDENGYFVIDDGNFSALCLLGVEPCFESSKVTTKFSFDGEQFKDEYNEMLETFKKYTISILTKGGNNVDENIEKIEEFSDNHIVDNPKTEDENNSNFEQTEQVLDNVEEKFEEVNTEKVEEEVTVDYQSKISELENLLLEANSKYESLSQEKEKLINEHSEVLAELNKKYSILEEENKILVQFKADKIQEERITNENIIFDKFSVEYKLTEEDMKEIKASANSMELSEIEEKLFALVGKKIAKFSAKDNVKTIAKIPVEIDSDSKEDESPYGDLFTRYASKINE
jgi:hypothetical protein